MVILKNWEIKDYEVKCQLCTLIFFVLITIAVIVLATTGQHFARENYLEGVKALKKGVKDLKEG